MNEEIKEILDNIEYVADIHKVHIKDGYKVAEEIPSSLAKELRLNSHSAKLLLDYITNLQEKIKHYEETTTFGDYVKEVNLLVDYKSRIEKAVEYIKENCITSDKWEDLGFCNFVPTGNIKYKSLSAKKVEHIIDILNGRSDE